jgi:DNA-binding transcriptional ArsR family regulator
MDALSTAFAALADPTRRAILARLAQGQTHVGDLGRPFRISAPAISRHLRVLEQAGLIEREVDAQWRVCRLRGPGLQAAHDWIAQYRQFWDDSLDRLAEYLEQQQPPPARAPRRTARTRPTPGVKSPRRRSKP